MNDRTLLIATAVLTIFFFVGGLLDILNHFLSKMILFVGFTAIIVAIIILKSKDDDTQEKNLP